MVTDYLAYGSRGLTKHDKNMDTYSSMKLEVLGLKWAITDKFRDYLVGAKFVYEIHRQQSLDDVKQQQNLEPLRCDGCRNWLHLISLSSINLLGTTEMQMP